MLHLTMLPSADSPPRIPPDEVLFHCGKAVNRARFWDPAARLDRKSLPTPGQMLAAMTKQDAAVAEAIKTQYNHAMRNDLYG